MFNIGPVELLVVLVLSLIIFGPAKLPELMANVGHAIREFQRASRELTDVFQETQQEFSSALSVDLEPPHHPATATADASPDDTTEVGTPLGDHVEDFPTPTGEIASVEAGETVLPRTDISPTEYETAAMLNAPESIDDESAVAPVSPSPPRTAPTRRRRTKAAAVVEDENPVAAVGTESGADSAAALPRRAARRSTKEAAAEPTEAPFSTEGESPPPGDLATITHALAESPRRADAGDLAMPNGHENGATAPRVRRRRVPADAVTTESA